METSRGYFSLAYLITIFTSSLFNDFPWRYGWTMMVRRLALVMTWLYIFLHHFYNFFFSGAFSKFLKNYYPVSTMVHMSLWILSKAIGCNWKRSSSADHFSTRFIISQYWFLIKSCFSWISSGIQRKYGRFNTVDVVLAEKVWICGAKKYS